MSCCRDWAICAPTSDYLKLRGKDRGAAAPEDILSALSRGGFNVSDGGGLGGLKIALAKDKLVHKLPNGFYGLLEWYPNKKAAPSKKPTAGAPAAEAEADDDTAEPEGASAATK